LARDGRIFGSDAVSDWNFNMDETPKSEHVVPIVSKKPGLLDMLARLFAAIFGKGKA
jgi:hypothetical protein